MKSSSNGQQIIQLDFSEEMRNSYRDYAVSVIISRALPDVRDGLKPVQRRILYSMNELSLTPDKPHRKSARIVGDAMAKYHPHGDSSIYEALVHMSKDYSLSIPLVDGHGNFGSIDGDGAAAMRYTEARLSRGAMALLENLDKGLVPFAPNYDGSEKEPTLLPATIPNLIINGATGIAVGMATNMPPHNPAEAIDGVIAYMDNPAITTKGLMKYIKGPDFPTGASIVNADDIFNIYDTGEGRLRIRAKAKIEDGDGGRKNLVITQIPYTAAGGKTKLMESLTALSRDKVFNEIYDVRDESSKEGIRIVIEVKKGRDAKNLLNGLYLKTGLEDTLSVNMLAVKDGQPKTYTLKELIAEFVSFQEELYAKEYKHLLKKAEEKLEITDGLIKAAGIIDLIIEILRGSDSVKTAKECLTKGITEKISFKSKKSQKAAAALDFSERQADAILAMPLSRLVGLELLKLRQESGALASSIDEYKDILGDKSKLYAAIKKRLRSYKKQFGRERKTTLENAAGEKYVEEVKNETIYVVTDRFGYCKSLDEASYSRLSAETLSEYRHVVAMGNTDRLCVFTSLAMMHQIKASSIPKAKSRDRGAPLQSLCRIDSDDAIAYMAYEDLIKSRLLFVSEKGYVKISSGKEFETNRSSVLASKLDKDDRLICVCPVAAGGEKDGLIVAIVTKKGYALSFPVEQVGELKKASRGQKGILLPKGDLAAYAGIFPPGSAILLGEKTYDPKKIKVGNRNGRPVKIS